MQIIFKKQEQGEPSSTFPCLFVSPSIRLPEKSLKKYNISLNLTTF